MRAINGWVSRHIIKASATQNIESEPVGLLNRFYANVYHPLAAWVNSGAKRLKDANRRVYTIVKYAVILGILYLIFR